MNVLMINDYKEKIGGAEQVVYYLKSLLEEKNHNVKIWTSDLDSQKESFFSIFNLKYYFKLKFFLKNNHFDIVHIHKINSILSHSILLLLKKRVILHIHDFSYVCPKLGVTHDYKICPNYMKKYSLHKKCMQYKERKIDFFYDFFKVLRLTLNRFLLKKYVDHFICPSKKLKELMQKTLKIPDDKITHLPNFIEFNENKKIDFNKINSKQFLFIGRISKEKGIAVAIKGINHLFKKEKLRDIKLNIIGDGPELENLRKIVINLKLDENIKFLGRIDNKELDQYYQESCAILMPSVWLENIPIVALESMKNKKPIIASNVGGYPDLIEQAKNGYLFEIGDYREMAKYIKKFYNNKELSIKLGEYGFKKLKKDFGRETHYSQLMEIYRKKWFI